MSALSDVLHTIIDKLPFHSQSQVEDAHDLVEKVEQEIVDKVKNFVQPSGIKTADDVNTPQGTDVSTDVGPSADPNTDNKDAQ